jgi:hypothetical protein
MIFPQVIGIILTFFQLYFENRVSQFAALSGGEFNPYPHKFNVTTTVPQFRHDFESCATDTKLEAKLSVAGSSKRARVALCVCVCVCACANAFRSCAVEARCWLRLVLLHAHGRRRFVASSRKQARLSQHRRIRSCEFDSSSW